jgi:8-oxo-dGTP diphosphatase
VEAEPLWVHQHQLPFDEMWEDDKFWLPMVIRGERFTGRWIFEGDRMLDHAIEADGNNESWALKGAQTETV